MLRKLVLTGFLAFGLGAGAVTTAAVYEVYGAMLGKGCPCAMCGKLWIEFRTVEDAIEAANQLGGRSVQVGEGAFKIEKAMPLPKPGTMLVAGNE
jgi:hypothetical protein